VKKETLRKNHLIQLPSANITGFHALQEKRGPEEEAAPRNSCRPPCPGDTNQRHQNPYSWGHEVL